MIPRIIHQIWWQGAGAIPQRYLHFRQGWMRHHPGWQFEYWDEQRCRALMRERYADFCEMFDGYRLDIQRIDSIRYFILHAFGGVYLDLDMECRKPIDGLIENKSLLLSQTLIYNNAVIGSAVAHPFWTVLFEMLRSYREPAGLWERSRPEYVAESCGPGLLNQAVRAGGLARAPGVQVCPGFFFEPGVPAEWDGKISRSDDRSRSYAIHHMDMMWLSPMARFLSQVSARLLKLYWWAHSDWRTAPAGIVNLRRKLKDLVSWAL
jgi:hypothetical protein